ncbi:hypothetical protein SFRURICE_018918 [Spodoptera frugiperda]|nr:hypothetical protein SFRURICE_018918 [Spodoptera frugiperda]
MTTSVIRLLQYSRRQPEHCRTVDAVNPLDAIRPMRPIGTSLGLEAKDQDMIDKEYAQAIEEIMDIAVKRALNVALYPSSIFKRTAKGKREQELIMRIKNILNSTIQKRKSDLKTIDNKQNNKTDVSDGSANGKFKPILDLMLHLSDEQEVFSDDDIRQHLNTFVFASYDTTSGVLQTVLAVLGSRPDVQERVYKEPRARSPAPYPGALPIIGHIHVAFKYRNVVSDPDEVGVIANTSLKKSYHYSFVDNALANGLLLEDVSTWRIHRKLLNPAFNLHTLNTFQNIMNVEARSLVSQLKDKAEKGPVDVKELVVKYILRSVCRTSLGLEAKDQDMIDKEYAEAIEEIMDIAVKRALNVALYPSFIFKRTAKGKREKELIMRIKNILNRTIQKRKSDLKTIDNKQNNKTDVSDGSANGKFKPILDLMLHLSDEQEVFSDDDIRQHLNTFVFASYDTTSGVLQTVLAVLGSRPDVQERVYKEAGSTCILVIYNLHRHPSWGPDAKEFKPERWLNPATLPTHPNVYAPFSIGKRNCIGKQYAMMTLKTSVAHIVRNFQLSADINIWGYMERIADYLITDECVQLRMGPHIIYGTSLGLEAKDQDMIDKEYAQAIDEIITMAVKRGLNVALHPSFIYNRTAMRKREQEIVTSIKNVLNSIIQKRKSDIKSSSSVYSRNGKFKPILDLLLHLSDEQYVLSDDEIKTHLNTFVAASYDTTSSILQIVLLVIGSYPDVQEQVYKEIIEVFGDNEELTKYDLPKLVYLEAVIKEVLRLYSIVPWISREIDTDMVFPKYTLRAGSTCVLVLYNLHRHPSWGPDAKEFKPERWLNPATLPTNPNVYAPFGIGKRNCIGKQYAMMTLKTSVAHIVRNFQLSADISGFNWKYKVILKPAKPILVTFTLRS